MTSLAINGDSININNTEQKIQNSLFYNLIVSKNSKVNIFSELKRVQNDIYILEGFVTLTESLDKVIQIIRSSDNEVKSIEKLTNEFSINEVQAVSFLNTEMDEIITTDYKTTLNVLKQYLSFLQKLEN
jgi:DNA gyrase/topoisomerase IV subunit A